MSGWVTNYLYGVDAMGNKVAIPIKVPMGMLIGSPVSSLPATVNVSSTNDTNVQTLNDEAGALQDLSLQHQTLLSNGQLIATGTGDNPQGRMPIATQKKPWIDPPDGSVSYDQGNAGTVALPVVGAPSAIVVTYQVPQGYDGVIQQFSWNFTGGGFVQGSGDLQAQMLRNGVPIRNYDNILKEAGTINIARAISPIRIYSNDIISLVVNHVANNLLSGNLVGSFIGYFYPSAG